VEAVYFNYVDIFDGNDGTWHTAQLSSGRRDLSATSLPSQGLALFAGGSSAFVLEFKPSNIGMFNGRFFCELVPFRGSDAFIVQMDMPLTLLIFLMATMAHGTLLS
jgi:hypothetical protein